MKRVLCLFFAMCLLTACHTPVKQPERTDHVYTITDADSGGGEYFPVFGYGQLGVERLVYGSLSYLMEYHAEGISLVMDYAASDTLSPVCFALWDSTPGEESFILAADGLAYLFEKAPAP